MLVKKVNAFTELDNAGNPAGVVTDQGRLTEDQMKYITKTLAVSETAFMYPSKIADYKIRFFSPEIEVDLCGHATIATFFILAQQGLFDKTKEKIALTQETKAGILPIDIYFKNNTCEKVMMTQSRPMIKGIRLNKKEIADSLNIFESDIDYSLPEQIVSTGLFTLPICVSSLYHLKILRPDFEKIKKLCIKLGVGSFHIFSFDTVEENSIYHARNFAPLYGINEDPVTGTANGAVCYYLFKNKIINQKKLLCEQGDIIGRPGRVLVEIDNSKVRVGGKAKLVAEIDMGVPHI